MAYKDNSVVYGFGQMGSIYVGGTTAVTSNGVTADPGVGANAVFVAITFVTEPVIVLLTLCSATKPPALSKPVAPNIVIATNTLFVGGFIASELAVVYAEPNCPKP